VSDILAKMLSKNPDKRFASMQHVVEALTPFAKRTPLDFSVNAAIRRRVQLARERNLVEHPSRPRPQLSSKAATISEIAEVAQNKIAGIDTRVNSETDPLRRIEAPLPERDASADAKRMTIQLQQNNTASAILVSCADDLRFMLTKDRFVLGRDEGCDLTISAGDVSGRHCELTREGQWWTLTDLGSTNGVQVNGQRVKQQQMLWHGDEITIAFAHRFRILDPSQPDPLTRPSRWKKVLLWLGILLAVALLGVVGWWFFLREPAGLH
jgi:hypothetical protein